ncbi:hypothetical protein CBR_g23817 [Chara braunii]|uniref:CCHC-type domain-containing protein n=1 Tax=Chara braunii TaxID=69332 RepID=A0A388JVL3_CHABU|nr:hypothetical protein CBR_g23817 [Chara braunii]|eukprot:GBG61864.1 hypothetical protein CBR_g23817 [Chara braunii]
MDEASQIVKELEVIKEQRAQIQTQADVQGKLDIISRNIELLAKAWDEQYQFSKVQVMTLHSIRLGFRDFAREMMRHVGTEVQARIESIEKFCTGAIEDAKLALPKEEEPHPRREPVKIKFPESYDGKKEENFDNWEANVDTYIYLQHIVPKEQVLIAFHALKDEAANFARSLARATQCENNMVAYSKVTPLHEFFRLLKERFADVTRGVRASDKLQTIHSRQWRSARALKGIMDELVVVPDHGVTKPQVVNLFYRAMPEPLRVHFFEKSRQPTMTYDELRREVVLFEAQSMPISTFWHKDLDKGKKWKGRTISGQVKGKDHLILTLDEGGTDEVPYSQIEWGLEEEDNIGSQGRTYAAGAVGGRPQGREGGQGQGGRALGGRGHGTQGVGGIAKCQEGSRGSRSPPRRGGWHPGLPQGRPWEDLGLEQSVWQMRIDQDQCIYCGDPGHIIKFCPKYREAWYAAQAAKGNRW